MQSGNYVDGMNYKAIDAAVTGIIIVHCGRVGKGKGRKVKVSVFI